MTFRHMATIGAILFGFLFLELVIDVSLLIGPWGVEPTPEAGFMGRRLAAGFLGFAVICGLSRTLPASPARRAISLGIAAALLVVAGFGLYELARGFAGTGILPAVAVEVALAVGFLATGRAVA